LFPLSHCWPRRGGRSGTGSPARRRGSLAAAAIAVVFLVPSWRRFVVDWIVRLAREATYVVGALRSPPRLAALLSANVGTEVVLPISMAAIVRAFHYEIGLAEILFITVSVPVVTGLVPIPGGVGVAESGLVFGLVRAGRPEEVAFAAVTAPVSAA